MSSVNCQQQLPTNAMCFGFEKDPSYLEGYVPKHHPAMLQLPTPYAMQESDLTMLLNQSTALTTQYQDAAYIMNPQTVTPPNRRRAAVSTRLRIHASISHSRWLESLQRLVTVGWLVKKSYALPRLSVDSMLDWAVKLPMELTALWVGERLLAARWARSI